jgi:hypothetical protein
MTQALHPRVIAAALLVLAIHAAAVASSPLRLPPLIGSALAIDLTVTAGLIVYALAVRPGLLPATVLGPVLIAGAAVAHWALPATPVTAAVGAAIGVLEVVLVASLLRRVARIARRARARGADVALLDALEDGLRDLLPRRAAAIVATEVAIVVHAVTGWRRPRLAPGQFTVHRDKDWSLFAGVLIALTVVETVGLHLVIAPHNTVLAWVLTGLSAYSALWLLGDAQALRHTGVRISDSHLHLAVGLRWRAEIPWSAVTAVERIETRPPRAAGTVDASILEATTAFHLDPPVLVRGPLGIERRAHLLVTTIDDADRFIELARRHASSARGSHVGVDGSSEPV